MIPLFLRKRLPLIPHRRNGSSWSERRAFAVILLLLICLIALVPSTQAHGYIVRSIPEDREALERAPIRVQYWFSEDLEPEFSSITVRDQSGNVVATGG